MPAGRPSSYKPEFAEKAARFTSVGAIDEELADLFGVSVQTLNTWKLKYPEFLESIKDGKAITDNRVERTLLHKAIGGDTTAMIFWLKNRRSKEWRDRTEHVGANDGPIEFVVKSILEDK